MNRQTFLSRVVVTTLGIQMLTIFGLVGCGRPSGVVQETSELSYGDVASQIAAEEAASRESTEAIR